MDVDKLFKLPKLPSSNVNKRKWAEPTVEQIKAARVEDQDDEDGARPGPSSSAAAAAKRSAAGDGYGQQDDEGPELLEDDDDEGGRMYGGGLTSQQQQILEIMNRAGEEDEAAPKPEEELANLRKTLLRFERAITKNEEMRSRFADQPEKFIESEADLDSSLKALVLLTTNPALFYPETVKHGTPASLCSLMGHDNVDIVAAVIEVVEELTDDDVLDSGAGVERGEDEEDEDAPAERKGEEGMRILVDALLQNDFLSLLVDNLSRFSDDPSSASNGDAASASNLESDTSAIFHLLGVLENLLSFRPSLARDVVHRTSLLPWLLKRVSRKGAYDQNKGYASEILAILMQSPGSAASEEAGEGEIRPLSGPAKLGELAGIDTLLSVLASYRRRDPADADETEFMENVFDTLCACLASSEDRDIKERFEEGEGTELMCILMKEKRLVRLRAIKALSFALSGPRAAKSCIKLVERGGLSTLFTTFMGKGAKKSEAPTASDDEHVLGIIVALLNHLASDSAERLRLLAKFVEDDYAKLDRLLELREACVKRVGAAEREIEEDRKLILSSGQELTSDDEELFYLRRLESGLFSLQMIDYIMAWMAMEDDGAAKHLSTMLKRKGKSWDDTIEVLKEYYENVDDEAIVSEPSSAGEAPLRLRDVIVQLVNFLLGL